LILQGQRSKRKFKLQGYKLEYINQLLSYDRSFNIHLRLSEEKYLQSEDGSDIALKIMSYLDSNSIYEYRNSNNEVVPVVIQLQKTNNSVTQLKPISRSSANFLTIFSEFLNSAERINITY